MDRQAPTIVIVTVGHSSHPFDTLVELLRGQGIELVVDVRRAPYSRHVPHAAKRTLQQALPKAGIRYLFMGTNLGGLPPSARGEDDASFYTDLVDSEGFQAAIDRVLGLAEERTVAIMCAEEDPSRCHRRFIVGEALMARGAAIVHLLGDGSVVTEETLSAMDRHQVEQLALF